MTLKDRLKIRKQKSNTKRFIEIDLLRGLAILLMILCHILWDLDYFGVIPMNNALYSSIQNFVPPLFFLLVGICLIVSKKKKERTVEEEKKYYNHLILRGLKIFNLGMILTIVSLIVLPERPVMFGVLHCIGLSIILSAPFLKYRCCNLLFAIAIIFTGILFAQFNIENPTIIHLAFGLHQTAFWRFTVDYFPILPWFGVVLLGIFVGDYVYYGDKRRFIIPDLSKYRPAKLFSFLGQHSLEIYLLHQPLIAGALYLFVRLL